MNPAPPTCSLCGRPILGGPYVLQRDGRIAHLSWQRTPGPERRRPAFASWPV